WLHAAEATFLLHSLAIMYARRYYPADTPRAGLAMATNFENDFRWLESELERSERGGGGGGGGGSGLAGKEVTVADAMMQFSVRFILEKGLGTRKGRWRRIKEW
ncbi:hypothetical protein IWZ03DRAFT_309070, partial [Phyllosticta citriasiana]